MLLGKNDMRVFQEEIFGPVASVATFKDQDEALEIANDTIYGLGAGVWTRNGTTAYEMGRGIKKGSDWSNCFHVYPANAAVRCYILFGIGRNTYNMSQPHYHNSKCLICSFEQHHY